MAIEHGQDGDRAGDEVAVEEEAELGRIAEDRSIGGEREVLSGSSCGGSAKISVFDFSELKNIQSTGKAANTRPTASPR